MPIRDCTVVAVEGTHASGKTTLAHALTSYYRERGVHANCTGEPARSSPFMEEIVLHGKGAFDRVAELDTFARQFTDQLRAARHHDLLITDKTPLNVVAYARLLLPDEDSSVVEAMLQLCTATSTLYDAVLYTSGARRPACFTHPSTPRPAPCEAPPRSARCSADGSIDKFDWLAVRVITRSF